MIVKKKCDHCGRMTSATHEPQAGEMHEVDRAFYKLTVKERDYERVKVDRLEECVRILEDALEAMVGYENGPCSFDHHGYCQDHPGNHEEGKCALAHGRELLGLEPGATSRKA